MAPKKNPQPVHKSLRLIEQERTNVVKWTQVRIAQLIAEEEANVVPDYDWYCCLNTFCFCVSLILMNLLFLQWRF
jgi:hypothetical protein